MSRRKKLLLLCILSVLLTSFSRKFDLAVCGNEILHKVLNPKLGRGRGARGFKKQVFSRWEPVDLFNQFQRKQNDVIFQSLTRMYISEFTSMVSDLRYINTIQLQKQATYLTFENKIFLFFLWIVKYPEYSVLSTLFGVSKSVVGSLIDFILPLIAAHFLSYIPDEIVTSSTSSLSRKICAVIDSTIHATNKPSKNQHLSYNEHYKRHGMMTTLLVDFDGYIISVSTNGVARLHDSMSSMFMPYFRAIIGKKNYALGDPGYAGVDNVVSGFKSNQLVSDGCRKFDAVSRSEQVVIEHVNKHIKNCRVLSKSNISSF